MLTNVSLLTLANLMSDPAPFDHSSFMRQFDSLLPQTEKPLVIILDSSAVIRFAGQQHSYPTFAGNVLPLFLEIAKLSNVLVMLPSAVPFETAREMHLFEDGEPHRKFISPPESFQVEFDMIRQFFEQHISTALFYRPTDDDAEPRPFLYTTPYNNPIESATLSHKPNGLVLVDTPSIRNLFQSFSFDDETKRTKQFRKGHKKGTLKQLADGQIITLCQLLTSPETQGPRAPHILVVSNDLHLTDYIQAAGQENIDSMTHLSSVEFIKLLQTCGMDFGKAYEPSNFASQICDDLFKRDFLSAQKTAEVSPLLTASIQERHASGDLGMISATGKSLPASPPQTPMPSTLPPFDYKQYFGQFSSLQRIFADAMRIAPPGTKSPNITAGKLELFFNGSRAASLLTRPLMAPYLPLLSCALAAYLYQNEGLKRDKPMPSHIQNQVERFEVAFTERLNELPEQRQLHR